jgi:hypothetical protein
MKTSVKLFDLKRGRYQIINCNYRIQSFTVCVGGTNTLFMRAEQTKHGLIHEDDDDEDYMQRNNNAYCALFGTLLSWPLQDSLMYHLWVIVPAAAYPSPF